MSKISMLELALTYAHSGTAIFPCRECTGVKGGEKAPYIGGGLHRASSDEQQVRIWWNAWPNAVVGLPCRLNRIVAIDADRHGQEDGVAALFALFSHHQFRPDSVAIIATPRNGFHCLFRRSDQLGDTKGKIAPGIDVRDNAYIIAAGSVLANGLGYRLVDGSPELLAMLIASNQLPALPDWLELMTAKSIIQPLRQPRTTSSVNYKDTDIRQRLAGLVRLVASACAGERNTTLHWAACRVGEFVRSGDITEEAGSTLLEMAGAHAGLPAAEIATTVKSGMAAGRAGPGYAR